MKAFQKTLYDEYGGGANTLAPGYSKGTGLAAEIIGTFVLVYTVFSATDPKRNARDSHVPVSTYITFWFKIANLGPFDGRDYLIFDPIYNIFFLY